MGGVARREGVVGPGVVACTHVGNTLGHSKDGNGGNALKSRLGTGEHAHHSMYTRPRCSPARATLIIESQVSANIVFADLGGNRDAAALVPLVPP